MVSFFGRCRKLTKGHPSDLLDSFFNDSDSRWSFNRRVENGLIKSDDIEPPPTSAVSIFYFCFYSSWSFKRDENISTCSFKYICSPQTIFCREITIDLQSIKSQLHDSHFGAKVMSQSKTNILMGAVVEVEWSSLLPTALDLIRNQLELSSSNFVQF